MVQQVTAVERLMTCTEVDRIFRLKHGTARAAAEAGLLPSATRERGGHTCYLIAPQDAREMWGPK